MNGDKGDHKDDIILFYMNKLKMNTWITYFMIELNNSAKNILIVIGFHGCYYLLNYTF